MWRGTTLVACVLAVLCALPALWSRGSAELAPRSIALVVSDSAIAAWSGDGSAESDIGAALKRANVSTVLIGMRSVESMLRSGELTRVRPGEVPDAVGLSTGPGALLAATDRALAERAVKALTAWHGNRVEAKTDPATGTTYVRVAGVTDVGGVPVHYDRARLRALVDNGASVMLALPERLPPGSLRWLVGELAEVHTLGGIDDVQPLGAPPYAGDEERQRELAAALADLDLRLVLDDLTDSTSAAGYADRLAGRILRSHTIVVTPSESVERLTVRARRAIKERGVRVIILRTLVDGRTSGDDPAMVTELAKRLSASPPAGATVTPGPATPLPAVDAGPLTRGAAMVGALLVLGAAGLPFVGLRLPVARGRRIRISGAVVGATFAAFVIFGSVTAVVNRSAGLALVQLATAVAGAVLAVLVVVPAGGTPAATGARTIVRYLAGVGVTVTTGLVLAALGSQPRYLTGVTTFAGVKVLLLAPPLIVALYGLVTTVAVPGGGRGLFLPVRGLRPVHGVLAALVVAAAGYYLLRSGNYGLAPGFELWLRDWLDEAMYVRPRFKEALIGFPALLLAASWSGVLGRWMFAAVGAVGTAGAVDTFAHFHTPVWVGLLRTAYSVVIGLVLGLIVWWMVMGAWARWRGRVTREPVEVAS